MLGADGEKPSAPLKIFAVSASSAACRRRKTSMLKDPRVFHVGNSRDKWLRVLSMLASFLISEKDDIEIEVRPRRKEKTHSQRNVWHALLTEFGREVGYTKAQMKDVVKREFYGSEWIKMPNGKSYEVIPSSEESDRFDYSALIDFTLQLAAEQGILLQVRAA